MKQERIIICSGKLVKLPIFYGDKLIFVLVFLSKSYGTKEDNSYSQDAYNYKTFLKQKEFLEYTIILKGYNCFQFHTLLANSFILLKRILTLTAFFPFSCSVSIDDVQFCQVKMLRLDSFF